MFHYWYKFIFYYDILYIRKILEYNIKRKHCSFPSVFQIQTINLCNSSCIMCPISDKQKKKIEIISDTLFKKIITEIISESRSGTIILPYLQNEPLMDKNIFKKIKLIKDLGKGKITTGILTNGSLFNNEMIKDLEKFGNDFITISLDALTEKTYKKIRRGTDYNKVIDNINKLLQSDYDKKNIGVEFLVQKQNYYEKDIFKKFWKEKVGGILINYPSNRTGDVLNFDKIKLKKKDLSLIDRFKFRLLKGIIIYCPFPFSTFNILSNGDVILCCEDWGRKMILGNIKQSSIKEIWDNQIFKTTRELIYKKMYEKIPPCRNCSLWKNAHLNFFNS